MSVVLDLGCGDKPSPGALGVDIRRIGKTVQVIASVEYLPFRESVAKSIIASDVIEHMVTKKTLSLLQEWSRVLKSGGMLWIKTPNMRTLAEAYLQGRIPIEEFSRKVYGGGSLTGDEWNLHKTGNDFSSLQALLDKAGFRKIQTIGGIGGDWSNVIASGIKRLKLK